MDALSEVFLPISSHGCVSLLISDWLQAMHLLVVDMFKSVFIKVLFFCIGAALFVQSHFTAKELLGIEKKGVDTTALITEMKERHRVEKHKHESYAIISIYRMQLRDKKSVFRTANSKS